MLRIQLLMGDTVGFSVSGSSVKLPQIPGKKVPLLHSSDCHQLVVQRQRSTKVQSLLPISRLASVSTDSASLPDREQTTTSRNVPSSRASITKPLSMQRAKVWSISVENSYRYQLAGYKDESEYLAASSAPPVYWSDGELIKCLTVKSTGYFMYFRQTRECEDKHLNKVKLYGF